MSTSGDTDYLPFCRPSIGEEEIAEVVDTLRSIEQGRTTNPGIWTVWRLASAIGLSLDLLMAESHRAEAEDGDAAEDDAQL